MLSRVIPAAQDESGGATTPTNNKKQVSYRHTSFINTEIRRAGEQTSPQVARAAGHPASRDSAADRRMAALRSAAFISGERFEKRMTKRTDRRGTQVQR